MTENGKNYDYKVLSSEEIEKFNGGGVVENGIEIYGQPQHEGELCPDCGGSRMHFEQYQTSGSKVEEVYYTPCCGYFIFRHK